MPANVVDPARAVSQYPAQAQITDDLVKEVADKVFALWLRELRIEQERRQQPRQGMPLARGGR
jgi:hypothetical protein